MAAVSGLLDVSGQSFAASGIALFFYCCVNTLSENWFSYIGGEHPICFVCPTVKDSSFFSCLLL